MTFLSALPLHLPEQQHCLHPPRSLEAQDISLIIPVRDNQRGLTRLLDSLLHLDASSRPGEVIVVDNQSRDPIHIESRFWAHSSITLLHCDTPGPASARNMGARHASRCWLWFCDSDCLLTDESLLGYQQAYNGAVGYAGWIVASRSDLLSRYYEDQGILIPPDVMLEPEVRRPAYLITANALVYQPAFQMIGGFRETFPYAAGEDIDLGVRLCRVGVLSYAPGALVQHDFESNLVSFWKRFVRYGRGNRLLSQLYQIDLTPQQFAPQGKYRLYRLFAYLQWAALCVGYAQERRVIQH